MAKKKNVETYTSFQVADITGVKIDTLQDWMVKGFISPSIQRAIGKGSKNLFNKKDITGIFRFASLVAYGLCRKNAAYLVQRNPKALTATEKAMRKDLRGQMKLDL